MADNNPVFTIRLPRAVIAAIKRDAKALGVDVSTVVRGRIASSLVFDKQVEEALLQLGRQFGRSRGQVLEALVLYFLAFAQARRGQHPDEPVGIHPFVVDEKGTPFVGAALFNELLPMRVGEEKRIAELERTPRLDRDALYAVKKRLEQATAVLDAVRQMDSRNVSPELAAVLQLMNEMERDVAQAQLLGATK